MLIPKMKSILNLDEFGNAGNQSIDLILDMEGELGSHI